MCRHNKFIIVIIILFIYYILIEIFILNPVRNSCFSGERKDTFEYTGATLHFNTTPNDPHFYYINSDGGILDVPLADIYTNKSLYAYDPSAIIKEETPALYLKDTYYKTDIETGINELKKDVFASRYKTEKEEYF